MPLGSFKEGGVTPLPPYTRIIRRVEAALKQYGYQNQWSDINKCRFGHYCHSIYCNRCMNYQKKNLSDRALKLFFKKYNNNETAAFNDLRHLTILCEIVDLDQTEVHRVIRDNHKIFKSMRRIFPGLIVEGRHEIEVINMDDLYNKKECPRKIESIEYLTGGMSREMNGDRILVHFHVLLALNNHNNNDVLSRLIDRYGTSYCVYMTKLYNNKSMTENLINIASYPVKNSYRYHLGFGYGDDKIGSYINNKSLCFRIICDRSIGKSMRIRTNRWVSK